MATRTQLLASVVNQNLVKKTHPEFRAGDSVKVHVKIVEGNKERIQIFSGVVIKRHKKVGISSTFTVRKVSYNIGVERTFLLNSPRIEKIEVITRGLVRRSRLFYLRDLKGKASRIKAKLGGADLGLNETVVDDSSDLQEGNGTSAEVTNSSKNGGHAEEKLSSAAPV